jgi:hypothetical protein
MEKEVKKWLKGERDYDSGVKLYQKYGKNNKLKTFFLTKDTDFAKEKLAYELGKLVNIDVVAETPVIAPSVDEPVEPLAILPTQPLEVPKASTPTLPHLVNQDYPEELAQMVLERAALTNKKGILSQSLDGFGENDNEGRKAVMDQMKEIRERINFINDSERHWVSKKEILKPTDKPAKADKFAKPIPTDPIELLKEKKSLTEARSKAKKLLEKVGEGSEEGQKLTIKIQRINERYTAIEKALT